MDSPSPDMTALFAHVGRRSPCAKCKRAVLLVAADGRIYEGYNHPAVGTCDGSDACRRDCPRICVHAEQAALLVAGAAARGSDVYHTKVESGRMVPKSTFNCVECSKLMLAAGVAGVWLFTDEGWKRWTAEEFHRGTLEKLGMHGAAVEPGSEADGWVMREVPASRWPVGEAPVEERQPDGHKPSCATRSGGKRCDCGAPRDTVRVEGATEEARTYRIVADLGMVLASGEPQSDAVLMQGSNGHHVRTTYRVLGRDGCWYRPGVLYDDEFCYQSEEAARAAWDRWRASVEGGSGDGK